MNLIQLIDCWRADDEFSWNNFCFIVVKEFWYGKNLIWRFFGEFIWILFFEYYCEGLTSLEIWNLNINVSATLKYCYKKAINKELKLMGEAMKYFPKKLMGHEIFRSRDSGLRNVFWKNCKTLRPPSNIFNVLSIKLKIKPL